MKKSGLWAVSILGLLLCVALSGCGGVSGASNSCDNGGCGGNGGGGGGASDITAVNHVVIMLQENRSFDHYFGQMTAYRQAASFPIVTSNSDGRINDLSSGTFSNNSPVAGPIAPYHSGSVCTEDLTPAWAESHKMMNMAAPTAAGPGSPMDGFVNNAYGLSQFGLTLGITLADQTGRRAMAYFDQNDLNYYYYMASQFAMGDMFYSPVPARTTENRLYMQAATSQGHVHEPATLQLNAKTIWQALDEKGVSWKIYVTDRTPGLAVLGNPYFAYVDYFQYANSPAVQAKIVGLDQYNADVAAGTLPAVSFIETGQFTGRDEHPSNFNPTTKGLTAVNVQNGASFVSGIINKLIHSPSWKDTVFFWAMDEGGGLFDHVPPMSVPNPDDIAPIDLNTDPRTGLVDPPGDFTITGFRVPNFIVSPFAKKNYVSHTPMDYTAILRFIEKRWDVRPLTKRDATMPTMEEFFDFTNGGPWATPPTDIPTQNTNGACDFTLG